MSNTQVLNQRVTNQRAVNQRTPRPISKEFQLAKKETFGRKLILGLMTASVVIASLHAIAPHSIPVQPSSPVEVVQIYHPAPAAIQVDYATANANHADPKLSPFEIAGYHEITSNSTYANGAVLADRDLYMHNKAGLDAALSTCVHHIQICPPSLKAFNTMLNTVRHMDNPYAQIETVNGWVNLYVTYDMHEAKTSHSDADHRSLRQTVLSAAGVCDEQAQLKLYALEKIGFPADSVRYVGVNVYDSHTGHFKDGHAVTMVRLDNTLWVLNNQQAQPDNVRSLNAEVAHEVAVTDSMIEDAPSAVNFTNASKIMSDVMVPDTSFNSAYVSTYDNSSNQGVTITDEAKGVSSSNYMTPDDDHLSPDVTQQIMQAERSAISFHYQIQNGHYAYG